MVVAGHRLRAHRLGAAADPRRRRSASSRRPATRSGRSSPSSRPPCRRPSRTRAGPRRSPGTTSSATSRPRPARSVPGCSARRCSTAALRRVDAYRAIVVGYALIGLVMVVGFWRLGPAIEAPPRGAVARTASAAGSASGGRSGSSCGCRSCSRSTPSAAASSRRASWPTGSTSSSGSSPAALGVDLLRREPAGRRVVAARRPGSRRGSASSTRWSSPTCRRTCC